jgi:hypothetical protein
VSSYDLRVSLITTDELAWLLAHPEDALSAVEDRCEDFQLAVADGDWLDLGEDWHALHLMLTGTSYEGEFPLSFLQSGATILEYDHEEVPGWAPNCVVARRTCEPAATER